MGCDIHMAVEVREGGTWRFLDVPPYHTRDYAVFECLAGVRARHGWTPIAAPRGFPADASPEALEAAHGDHTATWLSVQEIIDYFRPYGCDVSTDPAVIERVMTGHGFMVWLDALIRWRDDKMDDGGANFQTYDEVIDSLRLVFNFDS